MKAQAKPLQRQAAADPAAEVDALLDWLAAHRHLSDERFVESRVHARAARYGNLRIRQELAQHGAAIDAATAEQLKSSETGARPCRLGPQVRRRTGLRCGGSFAPDAVPGRARLLCRRDPTRDQGRRRRGRRAFLTAADAARARQELVQRTMLEFARLNPGETAGCPRQAHANRTATQFALRAAPPELAGSGPRSATPNPP